MNVFCSPTALAAVVSLTASSHAFAFSYESAIGAGCHERITTEAWLEVSAASGIPPIEPREEERPLLDDLPFTLPEGMRDVGGAALLLGVRDNDLKGRSGIDTNDLATVHGHPDGQAEHCLRRPDQDEAGGSESALEECRAYIRESVFHAIEDGLDREGRPDASRRTILAVYEEIGPRANAQLPIFHVYMGQALHALQDSFTHTFRSEDGKRVRVVLNWVDFANDEHEERRDGPAHMRGLDACDDSTELNRQRRELATEASLKLLRAALDPAEAAGERRARVDAVIDEYLSFEAGCGYEDRWCDAQEQLLRDPSGCSVTGAAGLSSLLGIALAGLLRRRRQKLLVSGAGMKSLMALLAVAISLGAFEAGAEERQAGPSMLACVPGQQIPCACEDGSVGAQSCDAKGASYGECRCTRYAGSGGGVVLQAIPGAGNTTSVTAVSSGPELPVGLYLGSGVSIDRSALVTTLGAWYPIDEYWSVGANIQWNPWWSIETKRFRPGATNVYASVVRHYPINDWATARTSAHLGVSVLLYDLYGAPASSVGAYAAFSFLGMELKLSRGWTMIVDPCEVAIPAPHLTGAPITYRQYRFTLGFQYGG